MPRADGKRRFFLRVIFHAGNHECRKRFFVSCVFSGFLNSCFFLSAKFLFSFALAFPHRKITRMMPADYHMHTPLCHHASGTPCDYARAAIERGLDEIGFADHNPMEKQFDDWRMGLSDLPRYFDLVAEAREKFPQLTIRLGLECDFLPGHEAWIEKLATMAEWDYLIGSVHYLPGGFEVDHPRHMKRHMGGERDEIWAGYWKIYEQAIRSKFFDFVAQRKFFRRKQRGGQWRRRFALFFQKAVKPLAQRADAHEQIRERGGDLLRALQFVR